MHFNGNLKRLSSFPVNYLCVQAAQLDGCEERRVCVCWWRPGKENAPFTHPPPPASPVGGPGGLGVGALQLQTKVRLMVVMLQ